MRLLLVWAGAVGLELIEGPALTEGPVVADPVIADPAGDVPALGNMITEIGLSLLTAESKGITFKITCKNPVVWTAVAYGSYPSTEKVRESSIVLEVIPNSPIKPE